MVKFNKTTKTTSKKTLRKERHVRFALGSKMGKGALNDALPKVPPKAPKVSRKTLKTPFEEEFDVAFDEMVDARKALESSVAALDAIPMPMQPLRLERQTTTDTYAMPKNLCLECGVDMGDCNPRQLCGKTYCREYGF